MCKYSVYNVILILNLFLTTTDIDFNYGLFWIVVAKRFIQIYNYIHPNRF